MTVTVEELGIPGVRLITRARHRDVRGTLEELFATPDYLDHGLPSSFEQLNLSTSTARGTVRGLHYSTDPRSVSKVVTVVTGAIVDVAVDVRPDSPTFGESVTAQLSESEPSSILVPSGFAHGFLTLEPNTQVVYFLTYRWQPQYDAGILWNDPDLGIDWPDVDPTVLSQRDQNLPSWAVASQEIRNVHS